MTSVAKICMQSAERSKCHLLEMVPMVPTWTCGACHGCQRDVMVVSHHWHATEWALYTRMGPPTLMCGRMCVCLQPAQLTTWIGD